MVQTNAKDFELRRIQNLKSGASCSGLMKFTVSYLTIGRQYGMHHSKVLCNVIVTRQFTIAISKYDDAYMAQRFIEYFKILSKDATTPKLMEEMRVHSIS